MRALGILTALSMTIVLLGCSTISGATSTTSSAATPVVEGQRTDCGQIYDTAFRSVEERQWYQENCSKWPLVSVAQTPADSVPNGPEPAQCTAMRGKPYQSQEQRQFFLSSCLGGPNLNLAGLAPGTAFASGPDRSNCDEIRGTPYRSSGERDWFLRSCQGALPVTSGPDRTNCDEIRGTAYRSPAERDWYLANCPAQIANLAQTNAPVITSPPPGLIPVLAAPPANQGGNGRNQGKR